MLMKGVRLQRNLKTILKHFRKFCSCFGEKVEKSKNKTAHIYAAYQFMFKFLTEIKYPPPPHSDYIVCEHKNVV